MSDTHESWTLLSKPSPMTSAALSVLATAPADDKRRALDRIFAGASARQAQAAR